MAQMTRFRERMVLFVVMTIDDVIMCCYEAVLLHLYVQFFCQIYVISIPASVQYADFVEAVNEMGLAIGPRQCE